MKKIIKKLKRYMSTITRAATELLNLVCVCICVQYCQGREMPTGWIIAKGKEAGRELRERRGKKQKNKPPH